MLPLPAKVAGREVDTRPRSRTGVVSAGELRTEEKVAPYGPPFDVWRIGDPHSIELLGPPGGGKSTLATRMAVSAARRIEVLYVAAEEGHSRTLAERLARAGLDDMTAKRIRVSDARTPPEVAEDLASCKARLIVVDSATQLGAEPEQLAAMLLGRSWIVISQLNARGGAHGGAGFSHAVDVVMKVESGVATPSKNRFGPMDTIAVWKEAA